MQKAIQFFSAELLNISFGKGGGIDSQFHLTVSRSSRSPKSDRLTVCRFFTQNEAKNEILNYITFYNSIRFHSSLWYLLPMTYEKEQYLKVAQFYVRFYLTITVTYKCGKVRAMQFFVSNVIWDEGKIMQIYRSMVEENLGDPDGTLIFG